MDQHCSMRRRVRGRGVIAMVWGVCVVACTPAPDAPPPSVSWLRAHQEERLELLSRCGDDPGTLGRTPACVNARRATLLQDIGSFRDLPPMGLSLAPAAPGTPGPARGDLPPRGR